MPFCAQLTGNKIEKLLSADGVQTLRDSQQWAVSDNVVARS
jgi:hypothetical protein